MAYEKIELEVQVADQDIDDIMVAALEGGINYWCIQAEVDGDYLGEYASDQISRGGRLKLHLDEPYNDTDMFVLDRERFISGLKKYIASGRFGVVQQETGKYGVPTGKLLLDACQVDAGDADCIVQYGLFGEVVFG